MNVVELKEKKISELTHLAKDFNIEGASHLRARDTGDSAGWLWVFTVARL